MSTPLRDASTKVDVNTLKKYLKDRGLGNELLYSKVGIELAGPARCREVLGLKPDPMDTRLGIIYHYPPTEGATGTSYASVRWFGKYAGAFGQTANLKLQCPGGRPVRAYVSPLSPPVEEGGDVWLCESVLKAIVLSTTGRYAVGGNGVSCLYVRGEFVEGFPVDSVDRAKRVIIAFDNDTKTNPDVAAARRRLTQGLRDRWSNIEILWAELPDPPAAADGTGSAGKWGLDDYIASHDDANAAVAAIPLEPAAATDVQRMVDEINDEFCLCLSPPCIIRKSTGVTYSRNEWAGLVVADKKVWQGDKCVEGSKVWLASEEREMVERIEYTPGGPLLSPNGEAYNIWRDDGVTAASGDVAPFLKVYENAIPDGATRTLLFKSFAWILQNRGTKLEKTFVFVGRQVGTGKSLLAQTFARILGASNFVSIGLEDFQSDFNSAFAAKEMVLIDDLHRMGQKEISKLRRYTTDRTIVVNAKNVRQYSIRNMAVFVITTNEYAALAMDDVERRNLVVHFDPVVHHQPRGAGDAGGDSWWADYIRWLDADGGAAALRAWFEDMDLTDFDPNFIPPMTDVKSKMIAMGRSDLENVVLDLWQDCDAVLGGNQRSVYTTEELWFVVYGSLGQSQDILRLGRALANKFDQVAGGKLQRYFKGKNPCRLWIVRRDRSLRDWDLDAAREDIEKYRVIS